MLFVFCLLGLSSFVGAIRVTGRAASATTTASVTIDADPPVLFLDIPKNLSYNQRALPINVSYSDNRSVVLFYNLDSSSYNITFVPNITYDFGYGSHTLVIYAKDIGGLESSKNVTFFVNKSLVFSYSHFTGGSTTNLTFLALDESQLKNVTNFTLQDDSSGTILFTSGVNLSEVLDLDAHINISDNYIFLNSTALSVLNTSATLTLSNLIFTNPRILRDGVVCSSPICTEVSYFGGNFIFTVIGFSAYSSEETPTSGGGGSSGSSGGGGGVSKNASVSLEEEISFVVSPDVISVFVRQGEQSLVSFTLFNEGSEAINISVDFQDLDSFLFSDEKVIRFTLQPGEERVVSFQIFVPLNYDVGFFMKTLFIRDGSQIVELPFLLDVGSSFSSFIVGGTLLGNSSEFYPGKDFPFEVTVSNVSKASSGQLLYTLYNSSGNVFLEKNRTVFFNEGETLFEEEFSLPELVEYGEYILYVRAEIDGEVSSTTLLFSVLEGEVETKDVGQLLFILFLVIVFLVAFVSYFVFFRNKKKSRKKR